MSLASKKRLTLVSVFISAVLLLLISAGAAAFAATDVTSVTAAPATLGSTGGGSVITVEGTELTDGITVSAFEGASVTPTTSGTTTGDDLTQSTGSLTFPANTSYTSDAVYTILVSLDGGTTWETPSATVTVSKATPPPPGDNGIDYDTVKAPIIIDSLTSEGFQIDLVAETLITPAGFVVLQFSVDGGKKWTNVKDELSDAKFPNLFNKNLTLLLRYDNGGVIGSAKFPTINKRPAAPKVAVNFLIYADPAGELPGEWALTSKAKGADVTQPVVDGIQIGEAAAGNKTVDAKGYGQFYPTRGIPVKPLTGGAVTKTVYFVKSDPIADTTGTYTPASKLLKLTVPGVQKAPNFKIDYKTETVKLKADHAISFIDDTDFHPVTTAKFIVDVKDSIDNEELIHIKKLATAKSAVSAIQVINPLDRSELVVKAFTCANGKINTTELKPYEIQNPTTGKWGSLPKVTVYYDGYVCYFPIRVKASNSNSASLPSDLVLWVQYGAYGSGKIGVVAAEIADYSTEPDFEITEAEVLEEEMP